MGRLQELFESSLQDAITSSDMLERIVRKKIEVMGIKLTPKQLAQLKKDSKHSKSGKLDISIEDSQLAGLTIPAGVNFREALHIDISDIDIHDAITQFTAKMPAVILESVHETANVLLKQILRTAKSLTSEIRKDRLKFERYIEISGESHSCCWNCSWPYVWKLARVAMRNMESRLRMITIL